MANGLLSTNQPLNLLLQITKKQVLLQQPNEPLCCAVTTAVFGTVTVVLFPRQLNLTQGMKKFCNSLNYGPSWEANRSSANKGISRILRKAKVITAFTRTCPLSLSWGKSVQSTSPTQILKDPFNKFSHLRLDLPSGLLPQVSPPKSCMHLSSPLIRSTCHAHIILVELITWIILSQDYRA